MYKGAGTSNSIVHFANSVLEGYLLYLNSFHKERYTVFVNSLGVNSSFLEDRKGWHHAEFLDKFFRALKETCPEEKDIIVRGAQFLYSKKEIPFFTTWIGLLISPKKVLSLLPKAASRMNHYNAYEFRNGVHRVAFSSCTLIQRYLEPGMTELNSNLCDASRGSITGTISFLGYRLLSIEEHVCVKKGDDHCEYEISWVNRPFLAISLAWAALAGSIFQLSSRIVDPFALRAAGAVGIATALVAAFMVIRNRRTFEEALQYQDDVLKRLREVASANEALSRRLIEHQREIGEAVGLAALGELSFSYIHDMAGPTSLLTFYCEELSRTVESKFPTEGGMLKYTKSIEAATTRLARLQTLFRSLARSRSTEKLTLCDPGKAIAECVSLFGPFLKDRAIELEVSVPEGLPPTEALEGSLEAILLNLVQNAIHALMSRAQRKLSITAREHGGKLELTVADTGPGIPAERLAGLWEKFGHSRGGSGFGLYKIKQLVERSGGTIDVATSPLGTTFTMRFPPARAQAA